MMPDPMTPEQRAEDEAWETLWRAHNPPLRHLTNRCEQCQQSVAAAIERRVDVKNRARIEALEEELGLVTRHLASLAVAGRTLSGADVSAAEARVREANAALAQPPAAETGGE